MQPRHRQAMYALLDRGTAALAGLLVVFALTRLLGPKLYGVFLLAETIHILLLLTLEQTPGQALIFFSANREDEEHLDVLRSVLVVKTLAFLILYTIIFLLAEPLAQVFGDAAIAPLLRLLPIASFGMILLGTANQVHTGRHNLALVFRNELILFFCLALVFGVGWLGGWIVTPFAGMAALVAGRFVAGLLATRSIAPELRAVFRSTRTTHLLKSLRYGALSLANTLGVFVFTKTDILLLGLMASKASVGVYGACVAALAYYRMVADAMNLIVFPRVAARRELPLDQLRINIRRLYLGGALFGVLFGLPLSLVIFFNAGGLLALVFGGSFVIGAPILILFGAWGLLLPFFRLAGSVLNGLGYPGDNAKTTLLVGAINVALNLPLIYLFDAFGAAVASLLSNMLGMALLLNKMRRRLGYS